MLASVELKKRENRDDLDYLVVYIVSRYIFLPETSACGNSRRKSGVGKINGTVITNRQQNSFKIKDNNVYGSSHY